MEINGCFGIMHNLSFWLNLTPSSPIPSIGQTLHLGPSRQLVKSRKLSIVLWIQRLVISQHLNELRNPLCARLRLLGRLYPEQDRKAVAAIERSKEGPGSLMLI